MGGFKFKPEKVLTELSQFSEQLLQSVHTLQQLDEIQVGQTPKEIIYREDKLQLFHYQRDETHQTQLGKPLLICYALVNRPYMVDLDRRRSFIKRLLALGLDIYLIDWGYPDAADRYLDMDDYINGYLANCVDQVLKDSGQDQLNLLGICQGGTLSLCYTALNPDKVKNLITMVTPVDFKTPDNMLSHLAQQIDIDLAVNTYGNIPGAMLNDAYNALMPMRLGLQKNLNTPRKLQNTASALNYLRMEKWINDSPDQAGEMFRQFLTSFFKQNSFINNTTVVGDRCVDLQQITQPLLNVFGSSDHLVPPSASRALKGLTRSEDYHEYEVASGHIGVFVSEKSQSEVAPKLANWLKQHE
ncbi:class III poly(R)-hydroxyalkanoic acid synthase subunit PhaC [Amphritea sp. 1_MG-2023]|uniref:class III poly(R)-hydroxyalkanoic acid synthase subunit PhaC n=1 Tax=Amphritea sp. 1_MG-2023 TaxID=3062670 RepID=UPI0026E48B3C|nr:class III poly(R)-hydroxyalkanoic acid synthase subunit PhaC [Amphritea sp. 1_MG-2023]MDO6564197.1 class III poly(R)-hydroxyalkanoic acid synthase subunit PhaC [Amphritea sp. 1_MG-2023]